MHFLRRGAKPEPDFDSFVAALEMGRDVTSMAPGVFDAAMALDAEGRQDLQQRIDEVLRGGDPNRMWLVALLAGAMVERRGDPTDLPPAIFDRIASWFAAAAEVPEADEDSGDDGPELFPDAFFQFEQAAMAALSRSRELRRSLPQRAAIQASVRHYEQRYGFTNKMLSVLDDEPFVVLHPSTDRGWICRTDGIADTFQLHTLLLDALVGEGDDRIAGIKPSAEAVAAASSGEPVPGASVTSDWQLANWTALRRDGSIADDNKHGEWIWNEGYPAEIQQYKGARVILVGPSSYERSWNADRVFAGMHGSIRVESRMSDAAELIDEIAGAAESR